MLRLKTATMSLLSVGFAFAGTTALTLPTDMGRSADVYTNAVRYFAAKTPEQTSPRVRPEIFAQTPAPLDQLGEDAVDVAGVPDDLTALEVLPGREDNAFSVSLTSPDIAPLSVSRATEENAVGASAIPHDVASLSVPFPNNDASFEESLTEDIAVSLEASPTTLVSDVADATTQVSPGDVANVALTPAPVTDTAGSSRTLGVDATFAADVAVTTSTMPEDLLDQMAAADSNFVVREGEGDSADTMMMSSDVLFSFGQANLSPEAEATLTTMLGMLTSVSTVEVFGHTDAIGSEQNNLALGQRRAEAVRVWLLDNSAFAPEQIVATGIGETDPFAPNLTSNGQDDPVGRAQNRRVEFAFQ